MIVRRSLCALLLCAAALAPAHAQSAPTLSGNLNLENALARTFVGLRDSGKLRPLGRIPDRPALRQLTCSAAQTGTPPLLALDLEANAAGIIYSTPTPLRPSAEFLRVAGYNDRGADPSHRITRFSVTAWPDAHDPHLTWVGVALYWSRLRQALDRHLTHVAIQPNLPQFVTPACLAIH